VIGGLKLAVLVSSHASPIIQNAGHVAIALGIAIRASRESWDKFWHKPPAPGWHDLFALLRRGDVKFEGDQRVLMAYLQYVKLVLAAPRNA